MSTSENTAENRPPPPRRRRRLANLSNVKTGLADVIRQLEAGEVDPKRANALVYAYSALAGVMQGTDLEQRLAALEGRHGESLAN
jgi:hypothetical protein